MPDVTDKSLEEIYRMVQGMDDDEIIRLVFEEEEDGEGRNS
jgi:hypothetical protein